ncbi:Glycosyltransferase AglE [Hyella patelloides LEGE 07179]|uniref:Glycosyltransferase AglE n=1 Tax=Hyella patelloides LEGE 07179 TaxID=945734 RepID=A0A563W5B4_9CYAN|nr:glycosyltransferase [Hyella patelloides]VEP18899.1 Glycosyltransferase AglE [Hyella patelloides LEGE 07179]
MNNKDNSFFVSVIIPVFNDSERLKKCLLALEKQIYPKSLFEIIVVDNNSSENIEIVTSQFSQVRLIVEKNPGSYSARNRGIALAKGQILAFIDSDCLPVEQWIASGVEALKSETIDLVGGDVVFTFSSYKSFAEVYDSVTNMQIENNIKNRKVSKTANLFVKKNVFDAVGLFPSHLKSGGDVIWTKKATKANFNLVYSPEAKVFHPARKLLPLLKKQYRVGKGQVEIWLEQNDSSWKIFRKIINGIKPPSLSIIFDKNIGDTKTELIFIWLTGWICNIATNTGRINNLNQLFKKKLQNS